MRKIILLLSCFVALALFGCADKAKPPENAGEVVHINSTYKAGNFDVAYTICKMGDGGENGIVITGGDGVTLEKLLQVCDAFARQGVVALAHENVNGTLGENVMAVERGVEELREKNAGLKSVALWAHSSGTIFSTFAAYRSNISAFVETSGHFQIPLCDSRAFPSDYCAAYLEEFPSPVMIVHGGADKVVDVGFARAFQRRLDALGKPNSILIVEGGAHEFLIDREAVAESEAEFVKNASRVR